uniref:Uncharacterized protein n=1 Tax=Glossina palpalis gambiensis TaxID=67801 RepID=A0A1B0BX68_9MUSC
MKQQNKNKSREKGRKVTFPAGCLGICGELLFILFCIALEILSHSHCNLINSLSMPLSSGSRSKSLEVK